MPNYQYNGEHYRVSVENIPFVKGEITAISDDDEKILLSSSFGQAMLKSGELLQLTTDKSHATPTPNDTDKPKRKTKADTPKDKTTSELGGEVPSGEA